MGRLDVTVGLRNRVNVRGGRIRLGNDETWFEVGQDPVIVGRNPACQVVGISVNTSSMNEEKAVAYLKETENRMGLPTVDPYRHGAERLVDALAGI